MDALALLQIVLFYEVVHRDDAFGRSCPATTLSFPPG